MSNSSGFYFVPLPAGRIHLAVGVVIAVRNQSAQNALNLPVGVDLRLVNTSSFRLNLFQCHRAI